MAFGSVSSRRGERRYPPMGGVRLVVRLAVPAGRGRSAEWRRGLSRVSAGVDGRRRRRKSDMPAGSIAVEPSTETVCAAD